MSSSIFPIKDNVYSLKLCKPLCILPNHGYKVTVFEFLMSVSLLVGVSLRCQSTWSECQFLNSETLFLS